MNTNELRKAANEMVSEGVKQTAIANKIGVKPQQFGQFLSGSVGLGDEKKARLEEFLKARGVNGEILPSFFDVVASELIALAAVLKSELSDKCKAGRFRSQIESYASCIPDYIKTFSTPSTASELHNDTLLSVSDTQPTIPKSKQKKRTKKA